MTPLSISELTTQDERWTATIEIPADTAYVTGHFPGEPILPGIAEIGLVLQVLERGGAPAVLTGLKSFRFRNPVRPGDVLQLELRPPGEQASVTFDLRRGDDRIANGTLFLEARGESA